MSNKKSKVDFYDYNWTGRQSADLVNHVCRPDLGPATKNPERDKQKLLRYNVLKKILLVFPELERKKNPDGTTPPLPNPTETRKITISKQELGAINDGIVEAISNTSSGEMVRILMTVAEKITRTGNSIQAKLDVDTAPEFDDFRDGEEPEPEPEPELEEKK